MALAYATSDRGAGHNRAWPIAYDAVGKLDPFTMEGKAKIVQTWQIQSSLKWSIIACDFLAADLNLFATLVNAVCETDYMEESFKTVGRRVWTLTRLFRRLLDKRMTPCHHGCILNRCLRGPRRASLSLSEISRRH